jgi:TRAP-type uncharacterized transport system substrate-binding protein
MKFNLITGAVVIAAMTALPAAADNHSVDKTGWPESFTVGTASQGGTYFGYGTGWANLLAKNSAFPAAVKSPAARCRTWRWFIPVICRSA